MKGEVREMSGYMKPQARGVRSLAAILLALALSLSAAPVYSNGHTQTPSGEYAVRAGDILDIVVVGDPDLSRLVTVSQDGSIFLPLIGNVHVVGLTIRQVEDRLTELLKRYLKTPKVIVTFRQASLDRDYVYVLGQVSRPGQYELRRGWTVGELLAMAGGPTTRAALRRAVILRRINGTTAIPINLEKLMNGDVTQNQELKVGDVLVVPEVNDRVLVLGEVARPGYQDLKEGDRVVDMVTRAGGPTLKAAPEKISINRDGEPIKVNLEAFLRQGDMLQNVEVKAGDVIFVPETDRRVLVMGEVARPGSFVLESNVVSRVLDVVMLAGGPNKGAKLSEVMVVRQNGDKPGGISVNLEAVLKGGSTEQNIIIKPGDLVYVPGGLGIQLKDLLEFFSGFRLLRTLFGLPGG